MRAPLSLAISLALALALPALGHAAPAADAYAESIVELRVNGQPETRTLFVRRDAEGRLLVKASDLAALRIRLPSAGAQVVNGERYYRLDTEPGARVVFDEATLTAEVTLPPAAFLASETRVAGPEIPRVTPGFGAFVNYDFFSEQTSSSDVLGLLAETGVFTGKGVLTSSLLGQHDDRQRGVVRLDTTWTTDFPAHTTTLRVGDAISASGAWGRSVRFGGIQFGTNFATQPTLVTTPMLSAQGDAVVPSTVDVFVNGQPVASQQVPPGPFTIDHVPAITGAGQMQVVVTDALGRQQVIAQPYYTGPMLLRGGLSEYSVELGAIRRDYGAESNRYGTLVAAGTWRHGFSDTLTGELHFEGSADGPRAVGIDAAWQVGSLGVLSATAAAGGDDEFGWLGGVGFERSSDRMNVFARTQFASRGFAQLGDSIEQRRPQSRSFGGVGFNLGRAGSLQLAYGRQSFWDAPSEDTLGISHSVTVGAYGFLSLIASQRFGEDDGLELFANWTMPFGERKTAAVALQHSGGDAPGDGFEAVASLQKNLPPGSGVGYRMLVSSDNDGQAGYSLQGRAGMIEVDVARRNGEDGWRAEATGALAITSAGIMPTRRLDRSFAVVKVADYAGLTVYVENQPIGRTDAHGRVLLDSLRAYERNNVSIDPQQLPLDATLVTASMDVTPGYRSGPVVSFPVEHASPATFRLVLADGTPVPPGAQVTVAGRSAPVAMQGLVYLENAAGRHHAVAEWADRRCSFELARPEDAGPVPDLGTIACLPATE